MEITGRIKTVLPLQQGTSQRGPWSKAIIVIEYQSGNYTNMLALENMAKADEFASLSAIMPSGANNESAPLISVKSNGSQPSSGFPL